MSARTAASTTSTTAREAIANLLQLKAGTFGFVYPGPMPERWSQAAVTLRSWWTARMSSAAERAVHQMPPDATFEPEFLDVFVRHGLEAALVHLASRHDLSREETVAVQATIEGLIPPTH